MHLAVVETRAPGNRCRRGRVGPLTLMPASDAFSAPELVASVRISAATQILHIFRQPVVFRRQCHFPFWRINPLLGLAQPENVCTHDSD